MLMFLHRVPKTLIRRNIKICIMGDFHSFSFMLHKFRGDKLKDISWIADLEL